MATKHYTPEEIAVLRSRPVLSLNEAAALTGLSRSSLCRAIDRGELPARKVGHRVVIAQNALAALIGASTEKVAS